MKQQRKGRQPRDSQIQEAAAITEAVGTIEEADVTRAQALSSFDRAGNLEEGPFEGQHSWLTRGIWQHRGVFI